MLFKQDILPFGYRVPSEWGETNRERRLQQVLELQNRLATLNPQLTIDRSQLRSIAEDVVDSMTANPGEGLTEPTI